MRALLSRKPATLAPGWNAGRAVVRRARWDAARTAVDAVLRFGAALLAGWVLPAPWGPMPDTSPEVVWGLIGLLVAWAVSAGSSAVQLCIEAHQVRVCETCRASSIRVRAAVRRWDACEARRHRVPRDNDQEAQR